MEIESIIKDTQQAFTRKLSSYAGKSADFVGFWKIDFNSEMICFFLIRATWRRCKVPCEEESQRTYHEGMLCLVF